MKIGQAPSPALGPDVERRRLTDPSAERIAISADRLERQATDVRRADKRLALLLLKEAEKLRRLARSLEINYKRAERDRMRRRNLSVQPTPPSARIAECGGFPRSIGDLPRRAEL